MLVTWTWSLGRWLNFFPWIIRHSSAEPFCASAKRRAVSGYEYDRKVRKIHYILLFHVKNGKTAYRRQSLKNPMKNVAINKKCIGAFNTFKNALIEYELKVILNNMVLYVLAHMPTSLNKGFTWSNIKLKILFSSTRT